MQVARFGENVEIGIGSQAVWAKGDTNAACQKVFPGMRTMPEGGMRARTKHDRAVLGRLVQVIAMDEQIRLNPAVASTDVEDGADVGGEPVWIPDTKLA